MPPLLVFEAERRRCVERFHCSSTTCCAFINFILHTFSVQLLFVTNKECFPIIERVHIVVLKDIVVSKNFIGFNCSATVCTKIKIIYLCEVKIAVIMINSKEIYFSNMCNHVYTS